MRKPPALRIIAAWMAAFGFLGIPNFAQAGIEVHDLAAVGISAPKRVTLTESKPHVERSVTVVIQNRSPQSEVIPNAETLLDLVTLNVESLGVCPDPAPRLVVPKKFPISLKSKRKLAVVFRVTFDCANDPERTTPSAAHDDFQYTATVHHEAIDGLADTHVEDDSCPHEPLPGGVDPNPDGTIKDNGAGAKRADGTRGDSVLTDVVIKAAPASFEPVLDKIPKQRLTVGESLTLQLAATDLNHDALSFFIEPLPLPANATFDTVTGLLTFTPGIDQAGKFSLTLGVTDGTLSDTQTVKFKVRGVPAKGRTSVSGRILDTNSFVRGLEVPVVGAVVSIVGADGSVKSDKRGRFQLNGVAAGSQVLDIDTSAAQPAPDGSPYAGFREELTLIEKVNNVKRRPFFLPRIAMESLTAIDPNATTQVMNPTLGVGIIIAPHTAKNADGTDFTGRISISRVPDALAPAALPPNLGFGMLVTIQPVGVTFATPVPITFPNTDQLVPGSETDIWSLDAGTGKFVVVGVGKVSADGLRIETISGGVRNADWHGPLPPPPPPGDPPDDTPPDDDDPDDDCNGNSGSEVSLADGTLSTSFELPAWRSLGDSRALRLVYDSQRAAPLPIIPANVEIPVRSAVPRKLSYQLGVNGFMGGPRTFVDTSGLNEDIDEVIRIAEPLDGSMLATGSYDYTLDLKNHFVASTVGTTRSGRVTIVNDQQSPFGAGWNLAGLQRVVENANGTVLLVDGDGGSVLFRNGSRDLLVQDSTETTNAIIRYDESTGARVGAFVQPGAGGLTLAHNPTFGPDGNLYVVSGPNGSRSVLRFNGTTGAFIDVFIPAGTGGLGGIAQIAFGPDGNLYADNVGANPPRVLRFSGTTGQFLGVAAEGQGMQRTCGIAFGPDNMLYVGDQDPFRFTNYDRILRFNGATGQFLDVFVQSGNLDDTCPFEFGPDGNLYVVDQRFQDVRRFSGTSGAFLGVFASGPPIATPSTPFYARFGPDGLLYVGNGAGILRYREENGVGIFVDTFIVGNTGFMNFLPGSAVTGANRLIPPAGDFSELLKNPDGSFTRTLPDGSVCRFDQNGRQRSAVDRMGNTMTYEYDADGRLMRMTDPAGLATTFTYAGGRLAGVTDPAGRITQFSLDAAGDLRGVTLPDGATRAFTYDAQHHMVSETGPTGVTVQREFDALGRFTKSTLPGGVVRTATTGHSIGVVDPASGLGTAANPAPVRRPAEVLSTFTDGGNHTTIVRTGAFGEASMATDAAGLVVQMPFNMTGNLALAVLPSGRTISGTYDTRGNQLTFGDSAFDGTFSAAYEPVFNNPTSFTDSLGKTTAFSYNQTGGVQTITSPGGRALSYAYDSRGLVTSTTDALGATALVRDASGNVTSRTRTAGALMRAESFAYTPAGFISQVTDAENRVTSLTYNAAGNITGIALPGGRSIAMGYDGGGQIASFTPPGGSTHTFTHDGVGMLASYTPPAVAGTGATTFSYDQAQNLTAIARPGGSNVSFTYDGAARLSGATIGAGSYAIAYEAGTGRIATRTAPGGVNMAFSYAGDIPTGTTWSGPVAGSTSVALDRNGRVSSVTVNGNAIPRGYDDDGFPTSAGALTIARQAASGLPSAVTLGGVVETLSFDGFGGITRDIVTANGSPIYDVTLTRDGLDRVTAKTEIINGVTGTFTYAYDAPGRLTTVMKDGLVQSSFTYDANGNRLDNGAAYDAQDRLTKAGPTTFAYTPAGELLTRTTAGQTTAFAYDALGNLRSLTLPDGTQIDYVIDGMNRRIGRRINGAPVQGFLYEDGRRIAAELDGANAVVSRFVYAGDDDNVPISMIKGGESFRIISDTVGSVRLVVNSATGVIAQRVDYDAFGNILSDTAPGFQPFGFAGGLYDPDTKLTRFGARDYDAQTGRWTAKDPLLFLGRSANLYAYCVNDPVNFIDPDGRFFCKIKFKIRIKFKLRDGLDVGFGVSVGFDIAGLDGGLGFGAGIMSSQYSNTSYEGTATINETGSSFSAGVSAIGSLGGESFGAGTGFESSSSSTNSTSPFVMPSNLPTF